MTGVQIAGQSLSLSYTWFIQSLTHNTCPLDLVVLIKKKIKINLNISNNNEKFKNRLC